VIVSKPTVQTLQISSMASQVQRLTFGSYVKFAASQLSTQHGGAISRTARSLGLSRGVLRAKLQRYGLR